MTAGENSDPYYDLVDDFGLIVSSFRSQYGIRLSQEAQEMPWEEFCDLLAGISPDTALGRMAAIRAEEDENILQHFSPEQHRVRDEWRRRKAQEVTQEEMDRFLEEMKLAFMEMSGGEGNAPDDRPDRA